MAIRTLLAAATLSIALAACGGSDDEGDVPGGADPDAVEVIREWADELRAGDVEAAADRFEIPSTVQNGFDFRSSLSSGFCSGMRYFPSFRKRSTVPTRVDDNIGR